MTKPQLIGLCPFRQGICGEDMHYTPVLGGLDWMFMRLAQDLAQIGAQEGEVPVGACVVLKGRLVGFGYNRPIQTHDPSAHAEIVAIRDACARLNNYRLVGACLYVTLEPCPMCTGALVHARIAHLIFGTYERRAGAVVSCDYLADKTHYNHLPSIKGNVLAGTSAQILRTFFRIRRQEARAKKK